MSDMQISIGFRWETGLYVVVHAFRQILVNLLLYKMLGNRVLLFC